MPCIRSSTDLRNNYNEISKFCHQHQEPVFITKNGQGDLAVMSVDKFELLSGAQELYRLLDEGLADIEAGRVHSFEEVMEELERDFANARV